jgi:hypothetical protein
VQQKISKHTIFIFYILQHCAKSMLDFQNHNYVFLIKTHFLFKKKSQEFASCPSKMKYKPLKEKILVSSIYYKIILFLIK